MITTKHHILTSLLLALLWGLGLASCSNDDGLSLAEGDAIAFASVEAGQETVTRAGTTLGHDFVVYGYKYIDGQDQVVFNGYHVWYQDGSANTSEDNSHGYYYVGNGQTIKYWDYAAREYHFWGVYAEPQERATFSDPCNSVLTIHDVSLQTGDVPSPPVDDVLYSEVSVRHPVNRDVVRLQFKRPYAKIRIQFYTNDPPISEPPYDNIVLTNISFSPDPDATDPLVNKVYGMGDVKVTYPLSSDNCAGEGKETVDIENLREPQSSLFFDMVTLTSTLGVSSNTAVTAPIDDSEGLRLDNMSGSTLRAPRHGAATRAGEQSDKKYYYYPLPMGDKNPAFTLKVCINGDPELRTAVVPASFMQWRPNFCYTYIFKITDAGKKIEVFDVQIDPWHFGGAQNEEWRNW